MGNDEARLLVGFPVSAGRSGAQWRWAAGGGERHLHRWSDLGGISAQRACVRGRGCRLGLPWVHRKRAAVAPVPVQGEGRATHRFVCKEDLPGFTGGTWSHWTSHLHLGPSHSRCCSDQTACAGAHGHPHRRACQVDCLRTGTLVLSGQEAVCSLGSLGRRVWGWGREMGRQECLLGRAVAQGRSACLAGEALG